MSLFETVFVITPAVSREEATGVAKRLLEILDKCDCKVLNKIHWDYVNVADHTSPAPGRFASLENRDIGYHWLIEFQDPTSTGVPSLEFAFRRDERVLRYRTIKLSG